MTIPFPPNAYLFIQCLGKPLKSIDEAVFRYARKPNFDLPPHSPIGGVFFERLGLSVTFCPPDFYHGDLKLKGATPIITNVQIYSGDEYYNHDKYSGDLPHGVSFDDSREDLLKKLGASVWSFPLVSPFMLERWDFEDYWLLVVYGKHMSSIRLIQIGLPHLEAPESVLPKIVQPDINTIQVLFRSDWQRVSQETNMHGIDFSPLAQGELEEGSSLRIDSLATHGVELYFHQSQEAESEGARILTGARYFRQGVHFSKGFDGELPFGLRFSMGLESLIPAIGSYPLAGAADSLTGHYVWKLPDYLLHVSFSVMEQWITRIRIALPPYYDSSRLEKPRLRAPATFEQPGLICRNIGRETGF